MEKAEALEIDNCECFQVKYNAMCKKQTWTEEIVLKTAVLHHDPSLTSGLHENNTLNLGPGGYSKHLRSQLTHTLSSPTFFSDRKVFNLITKNI